MATTQVFLLRFYSKVDIHRTNPYLMLTTALYLACKIEECPQHIRVIANEARNLWPGTCARHNVLVVSAKLRIADSVQADTAKLGECEFLLISELNAHLIIHHPYAKLVGLKEQLSLTEDEMSLAWSVVNDHYVTSLPLRFAPGIIAVAAVMMATIVRPSQSRVTGSSMRAAPGRPAQSQREEVLTWIAQSKINMSSLVECVQALISLYAALETYNERECKEIFSSIVKRNN